MSNTVLPWKEEGGWPEDHVALFHQLGELPLGAPLTGREFSLRRSIVEEEMREATSDMDTIGAYLKLGLEPESEDVANLLKELMDLQYTIQSMCVAFGWDHQLAFAKVCESNLTKVMNGVERNAAGKILKGPYYVAPDLTDCQGEV